MKKVAGLLFMAATLLPAAALAQVVGIGATKGGAIANVSAQIAKEVSARGVVQMRTETMAGTQQYTVAIDQGKLQFGIANSMQLLMAYSGTGLSKGKEYKNLRLVGTMMRFRITLLVANGSDIKKVSDLKGKRVPYGFKSQPLFQLFFTAMLANGGLTWNDVVKVPIIGVPQHWNAMKQGKVDVVIAQPGAAHTKDLNASVSGGTRFLTMDTDTAAAKTAAQMLPTTYYFKVDPAPAMPSVKAPVHNVAYAFTLFTHRSVDDKTVYEVTKALYDAAAKLKPLNPIWASFEAENMPLKQGDVPFHPGAVKFYKDKGVWKG